MNLYLPFPRSSVTQNFGENANDLYASQGLRGHTSIDFAADWGAPVPACVEGLVYSVMNRSNPDPMTYRAVFQLIPDGDIYYEVSYGHLNDIHVQPGQYLHVGDTIGTVGNTGACYTNGRLVTKEEKLAGSHAGAHLHGPQVRACRRVRVTAPNDTLLQDGFGIFRDAEGYYYAVINYQNGYNGCVAPQFTNTLAKNVPTLVGLYQQVVLALSNIVRELKKSSPSLSAPNIPRS